MTNFIQKKLTGDDKFVPDDILKNVSCKCTKNCGKSCGCVKNGLKCSEYCSNCFGRNCENSLPSEQDIFEDELDEEEEEKGGEGAEIEEINSQNIMDDSENESNDDQTYFDDSMSICAEESSLNDTDSENNDRERQKSIEPAAKRARLC